MTAAHRWVDVTTAADHYRRIAPAQSGDVLDDLWWDAARPADTHHTRDDEERKGRRHERGRGQ